MTTETVPMVEFLAEMDRAGIRYRAFKGSLTVDAPKGAMTPEILARLREHKADILAALSAEPAWLTRWKAERARLAALVAEARSRGYGFLDLWGEGEELLAETPGSEADWASLLERFIAWSSRLFTRLRKRGKVASALDAQVSALVRHRDGEGKLCWVHPDHVAELRRLGLL